MTYKKGQSFRVYRPQDSESIKIHVMDVLPSHYKDRYFIFFRWYSHYRKRWIHEIVAPIFLDSWVEYYKKHNNGGSGK